jgi:hypothetical protein
MSERSNIATFFTTHAALLAEKVVKQAGIAGKLIPSPRQVSTDCTIALSYSRAMQDRVGDILKSHGIETSGVYALDED